MAYSKINNTPQKDIKYLNKNYNQLKQNLIEFSKNYFPDQFNDFSESNPGMIFLELAAYVGDVLSFYTDTQIQETFIETAQEKTNLLALAYTLGYKPNISSPSTTELDLFIEIFLFETLDIISIWSNEIFLFPLRGIDFFLSTNNLDSLP